MDAVPAELNCAVPSQWISVQLLAVASQKFTCPTVTADVPAITAAVNVTGLPAATVVTGLPSAVNVSDVVVATADRALVVAPSTTRLKSKARERQMSLTFTRNLIANPTVLFAIERSAIGLVNIKRLSGVYSFSVNTKEIRERDT